MQHLQLTLVVCGFLMLCTGVLAVNSFASAGRRLEGVARSHINAALSAAFTATLLNLGAVVLSDAFSDQQLFWRLISGAWVWILLVVLTFRWIEAIREGLRPPVFLTVCAAMGLTLVVPNALAYGGELLFVLALAIHLMYALLSLIFFTYAALEDRT